MGKVVTEGGIPVMGVEFQLYFDRGFSGNRIVSEDTSDDKGEFEMIFYLKDDELESNDRGFFRLNVSSENLDEDIFFANSGLSTIDTPEFTLRDTTLTLNYYVAKKKRITVNLNDYVPVDDSDFFYVTPWFPAGIDLGRENEFLTGTNYQAGSGESYYAISKENALNVDVARNEANVISVHKRKNSNTTIEQIRIYVPEMEDIELEFNY